jgi:hypothetical protein
LNRSLEAGGLLIDPIRRLFYLKRGFCFFFCFFSALQPSGSCASVESVIACSSGDSVDFVDSRLANQSGSCASEEYVIVCSPGDSADFIDSRWPTNLEQLLLFEIFGNFQFVLVGRSGFATNWVRCLALSLKP